MATAPPAAQQSAESPHPSTERRRKHPPQSPSSPSPPSPISGINNQIVRPHRPSTRPRTPLTTSLPRSRRPQSPEMTMRGGGVGGCEGPKRQYSSAVRVDGRSIGASTARWAASASALRPSVPPRSRQRSRITGRSAHRSAIGVRLCLARTGQAGAVGNRGRGADPALLDVGAAAGAVRPAWRRGRGRRRLDWGGRGRRLGLAAAFDSGSPPDPGLRRSSCPRRSRSPSRSRPPASGEVDRWRGPHLSRQSRPRPAGPRLQASRARSRRARA